MTLQAYLADAAKRGVIDHALRAQVRADGKVEFYIHPSNTDGITSDFVTYGVAVIPRHEPTPLAAAAQQPAAKAA